MLDGNKTQRFSDFLKKFLQRKPRAFFTALRSMGTFSCLCYSKCVRKLFLLVFISCSSGWKVHLINCEGARKLTTPREAICLHKVFNVFSLPCHWISENEDNHLSSSKDLFPRIWKLSTGLRCVLCHTEGSCTSGGKNLERQYKPPCTYHGLNTAQLLKPVEKRQWEKKAGLWASGEKL